MLMTNSAGRAGVFLSVIFVFYSATWAEQPTATMPVVDPSVAPDDSDPRHVIPFLASDALEGRLPGTPGLQRAGDFLAGQLARIGLKPVPGKEDDFQPFEMAEKASLGKSTGLMVDGKPLKAGLDFEPMNCTADGTFDGKVAFAGYGISDEKYDDYAGLDVKGKVVLAMMKEPLGETNRSRFAVGREQWSKRALFVTKGQVAAGHGATALLLVSPPTSGGGDVVYPFGGQPGPSEVSIPVIMISRRTADVLLAAGKLPDLKSVQATVNKQFKPHSADEPDVRVSGEVRVERTHADVRNVMACLPGVGPHADEWVVVGAHYDHIGKGQLGFMVGGKVGSTWHGADDNASGTAAVLSLAEKMQKAGPLSRSVLFVFFTGEEEGLLGSEYFVRHPPIPLDHVVAMFNMDMVGRLRNDDLQVGGNGTAAAFDGIVAEAIKGTGFKTSVALPDEGGRGGIGPSDHASFGAKKIPVLFLFTGMHADYHRPTDTADKINYDGVDRIVGVAQKIVVALTTMPRQTYDAKFDTGFGGLPSSGDPKRVRLGIMPEETDGGVRVLSVLPGGAADGAGLKPNDVIIAINEHVVANLTDLSDALSGLKPGDTATVRVKRDGVEVKQVVKFVGATTRP